MRISNRSGLVCAVALLCATGLALAQGVDNSAGPFQLEGNATVDGSVCFPLGSASCTNVTFGANTDDWAALAHALATTKCNSDPVKGAVTCTQGNPVWVIGDLTNSNSDNIFTGGGSKDISGISSWLWKTGKPQGKDDIAHVYAAAYTLPNGHVGIYFGMDRFDNSGDATAGFWFLQDSSVDIAGTCGAGAGCPFSGHHTNGDLLIVSDFSTGGAVSTIEVFQWQCSGTGASCDSTGSLVLITNSSTATCNPVTDSSPLCSIVNPVVVSAPWSFTNKSGQTSFDHGEFLEGAIDLNAIFGNGNVPCFTTFMGETRSSTSPTATLSDFSPPASFPLCSVTATKACTGSSLINNGTQVQYNFNGTVINNGIGTLYNPAVYDTPPSATLAGTLSLTQPTGSIAPGGSVSYSGSFRTSALLGSTDLNLVSVAAASNNATGAPLNVSCGTNPPTGSSNACAAWGDPTTGSCPPAITKGLALSKACKSCLTTGTNSVVVQVSEAFKVCNTGNVQITNINVVDCPGGTLGGTPGSPSCTGGTLTTVSTIASLNPGACSGQLSGTYKPTSTSACGGSNCTLSDQAIAYGTAALGGGTVSSVGVSASCPVCPVNTDCSTNPPVAACPTGATCP